MLERTPAEISKRTGISETVLLRCEQGIIPSFTVLMRLQKHFRLSEPPLAEAKEEAKQRERQQHLPWQLPNLNSDLEINGTGKWPLLPTDEVFLRALNAAVKTFSVYLDKHVKRIDLYRFHGQKSPKIPRFRQTGPSVEQMPPPCLEHDQSADPKRKSSYEKPKSSPVVMLAKAGSAQLPKTTESTAGKPVSEHRGDAWLKVIAVQNIL